MNNYCISICIATYKRQNLLLKLIESIFNQKHINKSFLYHLIIVDNDADASSEWVYMKMKNVQADFLSSFDYYVCKEKGLANVRNELVKRSREKDASHILFVDDDEYVSKHWLHSMIDLYLNTKAEVICGNVLQYFDSNTSEDIRFMFYTNKYSHLSSMKTMPTGNTLINTKVFYSWNIYFDPFFNHCGGEDTDIGFRITDRGGKIIKNNMADAYEYYPPERANAEYYFKRVIKSCRTSMYIFSLRERYMLLSIHMMASIVFIMIGIFVSPLIMIPSKYRYKLVLKFFIAPFGKLSFPFINLSNIKEYS